MFFGIDFMAIWFNLKESVFILLASVITSTFSTDFSKVLTKVKFDPQNSLALNKFLEQLLIKHENLEWVDKLSQTYRGIGPLHSDLGRRKRIITRNARTRNRHRLKSLNINYENQHEMPHLNIEDYENAMSGVLRKEGYKEQRVKQKRDEIESPTTKRTPNKHSSFNILDLSIIEPSRKETRKNNAFQEWAFPKPYTEDFPDYLDYERYNVIYPPKTMKKTKFQELKELMTVVEPKTKATTTYNWPKTNKIQNNKHKELTITKAKAKVIQQKRDATEKKSENEQDQDSPNIISKNVKIINHLEKNIFPGKSALQKQIEAGSSKANIKSINLDTAELLTDPSYLLNLAKTTQSNSEFKKHLEKRESILEVSPSSVMTPEQIHRAKVQAKKLLDVDKDFNERNEPDFNKDLMQIKDYKDIYDYLESKFELNREHTLDNILNAEVKSKNKLGTSLGKRKLLNYNYNDDYENNFYSNYDDRDNTIQRYPRDLNDNYKFINMDNDYLLDNDNQEPMKRFYKRRYKKEANNKKDEKGLFDKDELKNKFKKLKNFFGFGHENNYNEIIQDDYPIKIVPNNEFKAKYNPIDDHVRDKLSENTGNIRRTHEAHDDTLETTLEKINIAEKTKIEEPVHENPVLIRTTFGATEPKVKSTTTKRSTTTKYVTKPPKRPYSRPSFPTTSEKYQSTNKLNHIEQGIEINSIMETRFMDRTNNKHVESKTNKQETLSSSLDVKRNPDEDETCSTTETTSEETTSNKYIKRDILKNLLERFKIKYFKSTNAENEEKEEITTVKISEEIPDSKTKSRTKNSIDFNRKYKFKHKYHSKYHAQLRELLKSLPSQMPSAEANIDELKLSVMKKLKEKNKKLESHLQKRHVNTIYDLDDEDYIQNDYGVGNVGNKGFNEDPEFSKDVIKHNTENQVEAETENLDDLGSNEETQILAFPVKTNNNYAYLNGKMDENKNLETQKHNKASNKIHEHTQHKVKKSCLESSFPLECYPCETTTCRTTTCPTTCRTTTCPTTCRTTTCPTTCRTTTCPTTCRTTCPTTCRTTCPTTCRTTCPTTCRTTCPTTCRTTCPTTCRTTCPTTCRTTCPTTCRTTCPTTCRTTCPTTCRTTCPTTCRTTCPTTCRTTTCPTTCRTTTCPTTCPTTCRTTTCPTTCPTTCRTTTCPTTCPPTCRTTCPTTCRTTCPTTCRTTCPTTCRPICPPTCRPICPPTCRTHTCPTTCRPTCPTTCPPLCPITCPTTPYCPTLHTCCFRKHSTYKFGIKYNHASKRKNILHRREIVPTDSPYYHVRRHKANFAEDNSNRNLRLPKHRYLYKDMPRNEYQKMKHRRFVDMLKRKYLPKENFANNANTALIRRKKSINLNTDLKQYNRIPGLRVYPKRYVRFRRRKMKNDDGAEDEKQRKVLESIFHHRIQRNSNAQTNTNTPDCEDFKATPTCGTLFNTDVLHGKISAKIVQNLFRDKRIKNIIRGALRSPQLDPVNPFETMHKLPRTHREVNNLLAMYHKLPAQEKRKNKYIYSYLETQKMFIEGLMNQFRKYNRQRRLIKLRKGQNLKQHHHDVWEPSKMHGSVKDYIKLQERFMSDDQKAYFRRRIKRENYFKDVMRTRRKPENLSKLDEWMMVNNEEHQALHLNFTF